MLALTGHAPCADERPLLGVGLNRSTQHSISFILLRFESQVLAHAASDPKGPVFSDLIAVRCAAGHTHADGFDRTTIRDPNTRAALLAFAVE